MKIIKEIRTYCPKCNKHTLHGIKLYASKPASGLGMGARRRARKLKGYHGKVKGKASQIKASKRQKVLMECKECKYTVERVVGTRTKKKLEVKAQ